MRMKRIERAILVSAMAVVTVSLAIASDSQVLAATISWNFSAGTGQPNSLPSDFSSNTAFVGGGSGFSDFGFNNATSASGVYSGASGGINVRIADNTRGPLVAGSTFLGFSLTLDSGMDVEFTDFDFGSRSTGTGPQLFTVRASTDNFATFTNLGSAGAANNSTWGYRDLTPFSFSASAGQTVDFRIYGSNSAGGTSSSANWRIDDLVVTYTPSETNTIPEPGPLALVLVGSTLWGIRRKTNR